MSAQELSSVCAKISPSVIYYEHHNFEAVQPFLPRRPITHVLTFWWEPGVYRVPIVSRVKRPQDRVVWLTHSEHYNEKFLRAGGEAYPIHPALWIDLPVMRPAVDVKKQFRAVCVARLSRLKRTELASMVSGMQLIACHFDKGSPQYLRELVETLHPTTHFRLQTEDRWRIDRQEMAEAFQSAHVALALSGKEGHMSASCEALCCGVPVVSTPSLGGRDAMYTPHNSRIVGAGPRDVAKAVSRCIEDLEAGTIDSRRVAEEAHQFVWEQRYAWYRLVRSLTGWTHAEPAFEEYLHSRAFMQWHPVGRFEAVFKEALGVQ